MRARRAVLDERSRIARDLHADVVPALRQALRDAEREVPVVDLSATLRQILADVEGLGASRQPIQLEIGGLVPALEWLAERVEDRSRLEVTLSVAESSGSAPGAPPADVAAAAFRVATLALDNVVRHAPGSRAEIWVRTERDLVELTVGDQGPGIASNAVTTALDEGRRGIADMMSEAAACGAEVHVQPGIDGVGTTVRFRWRNPSAGGR
jgi:signal transduction histidine kinase